MAISQVAFLSLSIYLYPYTSSMFTLLTIQVKEFFGAGTACIVCPVDKMIYGGETLDIPTMSEGAPLTNRLLTELTDIQV